MHLFSIENLFILLILAFFYLPSLYKRCPSNKIFVVRNKLENCESFQCYHGGGVFVWPLIQDYAVLSLEPIEIEFSFQDLKSQDDFNINLEGELCFSISAEPSLAEKAAKKFFNLDRSQIKNIAEDILSETIKDNILNLYNDYIDKNNKNFLNLISKSINDEYNKSGLCVIDIKINKLEKYISGTKQFNVDNTEKTSSQTIEISTTDTLKDNVPSLENQENYGEEDIGISNIVDS